MKTDLAVVESILNKQGLKVAFFRCASHLYYSNLLGCQQPQMLAVKGFEIGLSPRQVPESRRRRLLC